MVYPFPFAWPDGNEGERPSVNPTDGAAFWTEGGRIDPSCTACQRVGLRRTLPVSPTPEDLRAVRSDGTGFLPQVEPAVAGGSASQRAACASANIGRDQDSFDNSAFARRSIVAYPRAAALSRTCSRSCRARSVSPDPLRVRTSDPTACWCSPPRTSSQMPQATSALGRDLDPDRHFPFGSGSEGHWPIRFPWVAPMDVVRWSQGQKGRAELASSA